jgi:hypothetical protein
MSRKPTATVKSTLPRPETTRRGTAPTRGQMLDEWTAHNRYELQLAKADADRKVALEQC